MANDAVLYERRGAVGVITFNRPDNRNSMTPEVLDAFALASERARVDEGARCIVITGLGSCFSAGADFNSVVQRDDGGQRMPHEQSYAMYEPFLSVLDIEVPVIGALNGHAVGGGFGLALLCDIRIGNESAKYGANFARLGLSPGMAISYLLPRLVGLSRSCEMLYSAELIRGVQAEKIGLLSRAVAAEEVLPAAMDLAIAITRNGPQAVRLTKQMIREGLALDCRRAAMNEARVQAFTIGSDESNEGIAALLEKRDPAF